MLSSVKDIVVCSYREVARFFLSYSFFSSITCNFSYILKSELSKLGWTLASIHKGFVYKLFFASFDDLLHKLGLSPAYFGISKSANSCNGISFHT